MEDEVCDSLDKMKLTAEEEETIAISNEGRKEAIESCHLSLIGKFLTCKSYNKLAAKNTIRRAWGLNESMQILEVGLNLFQFKFQSEFDLDRILRGGPWTFDNQLLLLKWWNRGMTVGKIRLEAASLRVQIWGASFDMVSPQVAKEVGSRFGEVEEGEWKKKKNDLNMFMRVRVALPISKPIRRGGYIAGSDGVKSWISFKYERLPIFCHYCGILGHDLKHCAAHYAVEKNGGTGCEAEKRVVHAEQGGPVGTMAAHVFSHENPRVTDKDSAVIQGKGIDIVHADSSEINAHAHTTDTNSALKEIVPKFQQDDHLVTDFSEVEETGVINNKRGGDHVKSISLENHNFNAGSFSSTSIQIGPSQLKPKSTWTRINRMDFGLGGFTNSITLPGLGKRDVSMGGQKRSKKKILGDC
ncbi:uncharacterized protein CFP56_036059 [Quercus suber]|uniref:DUF4283 domain-containing protein n=1 Tax=Quercus suber TaxID=58331 RepID=A0AAW0J7U2_QUESU